MKRSLLVLILCVGVIGCASAVQAPSIVSDDQLAVRVLVPGTGITFQPPRDSTLVPLGTRFIDPYRGLEISVAVVDDNEATRQAYVTGVLRAGEIASESVFRLEERDASLVRDQYLRGSTEFDRWHLISQDGERLMIVSAAYPRSRRIDLAGEVRSSLMSVRWDANANIDPEAALGIRISALEGLEVDRSNSNGVVIRQPGQTEPPLPGEPLLVVRSAPQVVEGYEEQCGEVLSGLFDGQAEISERILGGSFAGCEVVGTSLDENEREIVTHLALLYHGDEAIILIGNVDAAAREPWIRRFRLAARSVFYQR